MGSIIHIEDGRTENTIFCSDKKCNKYHGKIRLRAGVNMDLDDAFDIPDYAKDIVVNGTPLKCAACGSQLWFANFTPEDIEQEEADRRKALRNLGLQS